MVAGSGFADDRDVLRHALPFSSREPVHPLVAVDLAGGELVVEFARQASVGDRRRAAAAARDDVVDLEAQGGAADAAAVESPLAPALVARPDFPLQRGGNAVGVRRPGVLLGLRRGTATLGPLREEQVERGFEDLLGGGARLRMGLAGAGGLELVEELLRDGHV